MDPVSTDSGIYTCIVASEYGCCTTSTQIKITEVQEAVREIVPVFIKEPVPVVAMHGSVVSFCARVTPVTSKTKWFICGRKITETTRGIVVSHNFMFVLCKFVLGQFVVIFFILVVYEERINNPRL